jgi:hypothetical protein
MSSTLATILSAIFIASVTSWITVHLSLKKFRSEKWWERKVDAYINIFNALHKSKKFSDEHLEAGYRAKEVSEDRDKELRKLAKESREDLLQVADVGAFLLCREAIKVLKDYESEVDKLAECDTWYEYLDGDNTINHRTIQKLIPIARSDLKIKG